MSTPDLVCSISGAVVGQQPVSESSIKVVAPQVGVPVRGYHLQSTLA